MDIRYIIFPIIYILINALLILPFYSFLKKRISNRGMAFSYSISISLGITFIITILFMLYFDKELFSTI